MHSRNGTAGRAMQAIEILVLANTEDGTSLTPKCESIVERCAIYNTGLKNKTFEVHHIRKPITV